MGLTVLQKSLLIPYTSSWRQETLWGGCLCTLCNESFPAGRWSELFCWGTSPAPWLCVFEADFCWLTLLNRANANVTGWVSSELSILVHSPVLWMCFPPFPLRSLAVIQQVSHYVICPDIKFKPYLKSRYRNLCYSWAFPLLLATVIYQTPFC